MADINTEVVVLGSGPGGYSAAFRAADLGKKVTLIERYESIGGVCLNVGCIPSKALLHAAKLLDETKEMAAHGIEFGDPKVDINKLKAWKDSVVKKLTMGLRSLARQRKVEIITGVGKFSSANSIEVETQKQKEKVLVNFKNAIIATGSSPVKLPFIPDDPRVIDSTAALLLTDIPKEMLVIGGGIIGLEMATVYNALGSKITVVEFMDQLVPGADKDVVKPLQQFVTKKYAKIMLETKATQVVAKSDGLWVTLSGKNAPEEALRFDRVLVAVGRKPSGKLINAEKAGVFVNEKGFIPVDNKMCTNVPHIFAIGDVVGNPMLAHKAVPEGRLAAEVIAGKNHTWAAKCIPNVAYTDPEIATVGLTETEAQQKNISYEKGVFPWMASGRSQSLGRSEGMTKLLFEPVSKKILGGAIVGPNAGELIAEVALAIEMQATAANIAHTIHPHPTLSETIMMAAEIFEGTITDLFIPKKPEKEDKE
ncbi:MAG: dihydrolipoyl dehydrogenase [Gammaproteobacteria bacterium]|nr:dihydrolipoyl dehydrogenase [Gammaproteobacteria bacterium]